MKLSIYAALPIFFIVTSCGQPTESGSNYTSYPLEVGNYWEYFTTNTLTGETVRVHVQIDRRELLKNSLDTYVFKISSSPNQAFSEEYYTQKTGGLYCVAYNNTGAAPNVQPKLKSKTYLRFRNRIYTDIAELLEDISPGQRNMMFRIMADSLNYESEPVCVLKYPLYLNSQWIYRSAPWRIEKRVEQSGDISVPAGDFSGYIIRWLYDINNDRVWDDDIYIIDFVAGEGLIQREVFIFDIIATDEDGHEIARYDFYEKSILTNYYIKDNI
jgi:hypothetical protein